MAIYKNIEKNSRPIFAALFFTKDGDLDLTWLLLLIMGIAGVIGFLYQIIFCNPSIIVVIAGWSFMGATFTSVLLAAIPISKAKILADSKLPSDISSGIDGIIKNVTISSSTQEISKNPNNTD